jgi:maltooligosyltrehalose synthase
MLGVSHVYASPIMEARPGSTHGYDIVNHNRLNPALGSEEDFGAFVDALHQHGMASSSISSPTTWRSAAPGQRLVARRSNGSGLALRRIFRHQLGRHTPDLEGRVPLPVLGDQYGVVLEGGEIELRFDPESGASAPGISRIACRSHPHLSLDPAGRRARRTPADFAERSRREPRECAAQLKLRLAERACDPAFAGAIASALTRLQRPQGEAGELKGCIACSRPASVPHRRLAGRRRGDQLPRFFNQRACRLADRVAGSSLTARTGWWAN